MTYLLVFFASLITTLFLTPYFITLLKRASIVDIPGGRKIHTKKIPRMGGLIIFLIVLTILNPFIEDFTSLKYILISVTVLIFSGIIDDIIGLNSFIKFIFQNVAAVILIFYLEELYSVISLFGMEFTGPLGELILLVFVVGAINSINLLDGLDGLASGFSLLIFTIILAFSISLGNNFLILLSISFIGSLVGFLRYNAFPASVYLGDTGAYILGFFLVFTSTLVSIEYNKGILDLTFPVMLLGIPLIDTVKVFFIRIFQGRNPFAADTSHQHYILYKSNVKHEISVFIIEIFTLVYILLAIFYLKGLKIPATVLFVLFTIILLMVEPFLSTLNVSDKVNNFLNRIKDLPMRRLKTIVRIMIYISSLLILIISVLSFSFKTSLTVNELYFLTITSILLLILAVVQYRASKSIAHINIFLNFTIYFIVSKLSLPSLISRNLYFSELLSLHDLSFYVLAFLIVTILLGRWKIFMGRKVLFSGIDLTMIVFILLTFIVNKILEFDFNYYLSTSLLEAFIFYSWFKIVSDIKPKREMILSVFSFLLPISLLLSLLIGKYIS